MSLLFSDLLSFAKISLVKIGEKKKELVLRDALLRKSSGVNADWKYDISRGRKRGGFS